MCPPKNNNSPTRDLTATQTMSAGGGMHNPSQSMVVVIRQTQFGPVTCPHLERIGSSNEEEKRKIEFLTRYSVYLRHKAPIPLKEYIKVHMQKDEEKWHNFDKIIIRNLYLVGAILSGCSFRKAFFLGLNLEDANFNGCYVNGIRLCGSKGITPLQFMKAEFEKYKFCDNELFVAKVKSFRKEEEMKRLKIEHKQEVDARISAYEALLIKIAKLEEQLAVKDAELQMFKGSNSSLRKP
jgi:hypothetical protein